MKLITTTLSCLLLVSFAGCDEKKDAKKEAKAGDKKADAKKGDAKKDDAKAAEAKPEAKAPELTPIDVADWGIKISVPAGAKVGEVDAGDADMEMPDNTSLSTEAGCGYDVDLSRHWAKSLTSMYENDKKGMPDGLTEVTWLKDEKTDTSFTLHYKGKAPLGDMYGASTGLVVGDRLVLCSDSGMGRLEEKEAACVLAVCSSMAAGGGDAKAAEGDAKAPAGDAKAPAADAKAEDKKAG